MTKLKIKVTKEILSQSRFCGLDHVDVASNCAISLCIRDIFPNAYVEQKGIFLTKERRDEQWAMQEYDIHLPKEVSEFINRFDLANPIEKLRLPEISFEIDIPDWIIETIKIDELKPLLVNHPTLELV